MCMPEPRREMRVASPWLYRIGKADQSKVNDSYRDEFDPRKLRRKDSPSRPDVLTSYNKGKKAR